MLLTLIYFYDITVFDNVAFSLFSCGGECVQRLGRWQGVCLHSGQLYKQTNKQTNIHMYIVHTLYSVHCVMCLKMAGKLISQQKKTVIKSCCSSVFFSFHLSPIFWEFGSHFCRNTRHLIIIIQFLTLLHTSFFTCVDAVTRIPTRVPSTSHQRSYNLHM